MQAIAGIERAIFRAIFDDDNFSQDDAVRQVLNKSGYERLQIERFIMGGNHDAMLHQNTFRTAASADSIESSMLV